MAQSPRKLFEEVGTGTRAPTPQGGMIETRSGGGARGWIRAWLAVLFVMVMVMIAVGGATRLTDSGLSITEWKPVTGALPPTSQDDWQRAFDLYQQSPQYRLMNSEMTLQGFKSIYWWEWGHRQLGRAIGLVWALGFFGFLAARKIPAGWTGRLFALGVLGGLQGAIGWWMVASGLTGDMTSVASYRLATHLGLAFAILGSIAWFFLSLGRPEAALLQARRQREAKLYGMATGLLHLAFLQVLLGALVAGIDAGRAFPTWPSMNGEFFPSDAFYLPQADGSNAPAWRAFFESAGLTQFIHRMVAYLLVVFGLVVWNRGRRSPHAQTRGAFHAMAVMLAVQVALGIMTAVHAAPLGLGLAHQVGAVILFTLILRARHAAQYPHVQSLRGAR
ncbi:heme A synthase [Frigidibacter sp. MR17.24]|uniref:heme A synthase n=1 Tax=Frigidibacter sp. MR17.24 TaxID=3127345 RepID=UPI0030130977